MAESRPPGDSTLPESRIDRVRSSDPGFQTPAMLAGRYEDRGALGAGGMAEVRRVYDRHLGRVVAMKIALGSDAVPARMERFEAEARATARLKHPNIVPLFDFGVLEDGRWWLTMAEVEGRTLRELMRDDPPLPEMLRILLTVARTVDYAHRSGVVHRDLKPSNLMVDDLGYVYVLDWGLVKPTGAVAGASDVVGGRLTVDGAVLGTPAWMAPEQAHGRSDVGAAADVYALGAMLYAMLAGRPPYEQETSEEVLDAVRRGPPAPLPDAVSPGLRRVCERAMARSSEDRYPSAGDFAAALEAAIPTPPRGRRALLVAAALVGVSSAAGLGWAQFGAGAAPSPVRITAISPAAGARGVVDPTVTIHFSRPMDEASVDAALQIWPLGHRPPRLQWSDDATVLTVDTGIELPSAKSLDSLAHREVTVSLGDRARSRGGTPLAPLDEHSFALARRLELTLPFVAPWGHRRLSSGRGGLFIRVGDTGDGDVYRAFATIGLADVPPWSDIVAVERAWFDTWNYHPFGDPSADLGPLNVHLVGEPAADAEGALRQPYYDVIQITDLPVDSAPYALEFTELMHTALERDIRPLQLRFVFPTAPNDDGASDRFTMSTRFTDVRASLLVY